MPGFWWQRLPQRVLSENEQLQQLVSRGIVSAYVWKRQPTGDLWVTADLTLGSRTQTVELRFPPRYPGECPSVRPIPYGTPLSSHQFGGDGVLCLELGPDNWHSRFTGADMIASAHKLLVLESHSAVEPISIPSRHLHTLGMSVRGTVYRLIVTPALLAAADTVTSTAVAFEYVLFLEDAALVYWATHLPSGTELGALPPRIATGYRHAGHAVRIARDAASPPTVVGEFRNFLREVGVEGAQVESLTGLILLFRGTGVLARWIPEKTDEPVRTIVSVPSTDHIADRLGAMAAATKSANVAIVGVGSIGSKVATSLSRSGVQTIAVVDGDVFLPGNVLRHDADYSHVGLMKVEAAAARIRDVAKDPVTVTEAPHDVADASNPLVHTRTTESLMQADVIVDATASTEAFNFLADLASEERRPLVWAEVFAGGLGGYVAYAAPDFTPCPSCVRAAFLAHLEQWPAAPRGGSQDYGGGSADAPVIASDADVTVIAGALTSAVLRILKKDFEGWSAIAVIGLRRGWIFERAFETRSIPVRTDDFSCERCWTKPSAPDPDKLAIVETLLT